jgi:hypothetical protein
LDDNETAPWASPYALTLPLPNLVTAASPVAENRLATPQIDDAISLRDDREYPSIVVDANPASTDPPFVETRDGNCAPDVAGTITLAGSTSIAAAQTQLRRHARASRPRSSEFSLRSMAWALA